MCQSTTDVKINADITDRSVVSFMHCTFSCTGDIAGLSPSSSQGSSEQISSGVVSRVNKSSVSVAFEQSQDALDPHDGTLYKLLKLANDITHKRLKRYVDAVI